MCCLFFCYESFLDFWLSFVFVLGIWHLFGMYLCYLHRKWFWPSIKNKRKLVWSLEPAGWCNQGLHINPHLAEVLMFLLNCFRKVLIHLFDHFGGCDLRRFSALLWYKKRCLYSLRCLFRVLLTGTDRSLVSVFYDLGFLTYQMWLFHTQEKILFFWITVWLCENSC